MQRIHETSRFDTDNLAGCSSPDSKTQATTAVTHFEEDAIDAELIKHLTATAKQLICLLLDRRQTKAQIMETVTRGCGDRREIIALAAEAFIDSEIERRICETDR
jgi:hypothetical protein